MVTTIMPEFMDSEYFVMEVNNWHLKDGAPDNIIKEFEDYKKTIEEAQKKY